MKNLLILIITIFALCGCVVNIPRQECKHVTSKTYNVVEIDSCEYLVKHKVVKCYNQRKKDVISVTHKGNCKYCQKRNKITIDSLV